MSASPTFILPPEECVASSMPVPSLTALCVKAISGSIERYPAESFGIFSEDLWEKIVKYRHTSTTPVKVCTNKKTGRGGGLDGTGRSAPAISDRIMREVESENHHLRSSTVADTLVWKDCVEYKFKFGGPSRPKVLAVPWPDLVSQVKLTGQGLTEAASTLHRMLLSESEIRFKISECLAKLNDCPMSVPLLKATDIGKKVSKAIKACQKFDAPEVLASFQDQFHRLLDSWKTLASASGVQLVSSNVNNAEDCTGRDKKTTMQQYHKDVNLLQNCLSWRDLFNALTERQNKNTMQHGQKMRTIRQNLDTNKHRVKKANVASIAFCTSSNQPRGTHRRLDDKLTNITKTKSPFTSQQQSTTSRNGVSKTKLAMLKKESAKQTTFTIATMDQFNNRRASSMFAASVSNLNGERKRDMPNVQKKSQVLSMGGGKRLKMPSSKTASMLHKERVNGRK